MTPPAWAPGRPAGIRELPLVPRPPACGSGLGRSWRSKTTREARGDPLSPFGPASLALGGRPGPTPDLYGREPRCGHLLSSTRGAGSSFSTHRGGSAPPLNPLLYRKTWPFTAISTPGLPKAHQGSAGRHQVCLRVWLSPPGPSRHRILPAAGPFALRGLLQPYLATLTSSRLLRRACLGYSALSCSRPLVRRPLAAGSA